MATYGIDIYGTTLYGTPSGVQFSAAPFLVQPFNYGRLILTWNNPPGDWAQFRLVRNPKGFPAAYNDGDVLLDIRKINLTDITPASPASYDDSTLVPGRFYYYSIFVNDSSLDPGSGVWWRAGDAYNQTVADKGWRDRFWSFIPNQYKRLDPTTDLLDQIDQENYQLKRFLDIFGYHADMLETQQEALLGINNPDEFSYAAIAAAGQQLGINTEYELGPRIARSRVKNATYIDQQKGTTSGLQNLMSAASGWVVDIVEGQNYLLSADQSSFVNPVFPGWDQWTNWPAGAIVSYNGNLFQAKTGGAFGAAQAPATTRSNNTWWTVLFDYNTTAEYNPRTGGQSTWYSYYTSGGTGTAGTIRLGAGFQSATDSSQNTANAYVITNTSGVTASMVTQSVAPIIAPTWSNITAYVENNYVTYGGNAWRATKSNTGVTPGTSSAWTLAAGTTVFSPTIDPRQIIADGIPMRPSDAGWYWIASYYIYAVGTSVPVAATVDWYDAYGNYVCSWSKPTNPTEWDSFAAGTLGNDINSVFMERGPAWSGTSGAIARSGLGYVYRNMTSAGQAIAVVNGYSSNRTIGCTVRHFPTVGTANMGCGLIGRYVDANNYIRLGQQHLLQYISGTPTTIVDLSTLSPSQVFKDGDRMALKMNGTALTIYKNNVQIWTGTAAASTTGTYHGIWEAY